MTELELDDEELALLALIERTPFVVGTARTEGRLLDAGLVTQFQVGFRLTASGRAALDRARTEGRLAGATPTTSSR